MDPFYAVRTELEKYLHSVEISMDTPLKEDGFWFMDVRIQGHLVVVQWNPIIRKFGVSRHNPYDFTDKPDEVYNDPVSAAERVIEIFKGWA